MPSQTLTPTLDNLQRECVLVQAWKKAHDYVRAHNWYADVLELDLSNTRLRTTIDELRKELQEPTSLKPSLARLVLAPKSSDWEVGRNYWRPKSKAKRNLRPLAHLPIRDQTIATAFMLCLADRVESLQGDPTWSLEKCRREGMVSYGHRLLTDSVGSGLRYRWANAAYYRGYFQDYQNFIRRPDEIVRADFREQSNWAMVHADFAQFYDRVRPAALVEQIRSHFERDADPSFLDAFETFFEWPWHGDDRGEALDYARRTEPAAIPEYDTVALPQGLAASGFFSNMFLLQFDGAVWGLRSRVDKAGWRIVDYCRYVDDLRLVLELPKNGSRDVDALREQVTDALQRVANRHAPGMVLNPKKTRVLLGQTDGSRAMMFSETMEMIQDRVSGALDLGGGEETLAMVEGLFASEPEESPLGSKERPDAVPFFAAFQDVKDETVARFSANRFRKTFRIIRPLADQAKSPGAVKGNPAMLPIDQRAVHFSRKLIWRWVKDPSNVRLLRISFDLNPDPEAAKQVILLLQPIVLKGKLRGWGRTVAEYCAAELFKAAATEIGMRTEPSQLPVGASPERVQNLIAVFAEKVVNKRNGMRWYLVQQALLLLASANRPVKIAYRSTSPPEWREYLRVHEFRRAGIRISSGAEVVRFTLVSRCFDGERNHALTALRDWVVRSRRPEAEIAIRCLLEEELETAERFYGMLSSAEKRRWRDLFSSIGIGTESRFPNDQAELPVGSARFTVAEIAASEVNPFRLEHLALDFLRQVIERDRRFVGHMTPRGVSIEANWRHLYPESAEFLDAEFAVIPTDGPIEANAVYELPGWIQEGDIWRYRAGQILRALVIGMLDFTRSCNSRNRRLFKASGYRPCTSHWYRRRYGMFNGRAALGPDWLPVSSWFCSLLTRLLAWPGFPDIEHDETGLEEPLTRETVTKAVRKRIEFLREEFGRASNTPVIRQCVRLSAFTRSKTGTVTKWDKFRTAVLQTVLPKHKILSADPQISNPEERWKQRRHFASALAALDAMLRLRETHTPQDGRLDLLVLPELSIHPDDIGPFLLPFARQHRCMVFGGLVYHPLQEEQDDVLVNAGLWLLPTVTSRGGLQMQRIRQGKKNLAPNTESRISRVQGWRPCQHIIQLTDTHFMRPVWSLSGSICYDATDLALASDLRNLTDAWLIPALNRDVNLFDAMVAALHYHMYQHVVVCNNGEFGGSVTQAPFKDSFRRTIHHHHGNEQATVSFFEIELDFYRRHRSARSGRIRAGLEVNLKARPAGLTR